MYNWCQKILYSKYIYNYVAIFDDIKRPWLLIKLALRLEWLALFKLKIINKTKTSKTTLYYSMYAEHCCIVVPLDIYFPSDQNYI